MPIAAKELLLTADLMSRLDRLDLLSRKMLAGKLKGERRSKRRGQSVEFADFRNYVVGDDLRFIDWNIYARLDKLFLKLFLEEEDLSLYLLVDTSLSMDWPRPSGGQTASGRAGPHEHNKLLYARRLAAALGYIGLVNYNRVNVVALSDRVIAETGGMRGRRRVAQMLDFLAGLQPSGASHFAAACKRFALAHRSKGVCVIISDFYDKAGFESGLRYLAGGKYDLFAIQTLSPGEIEPDLAGDLKLRDLEDADTTEVSITQPLIRKYQANLNAYCLALKSYLTRRGGTYLFTRTDVNFEIVVLNYLRERRLLG
ncbi:MAG: DUF58 domain-containing protein [Phycisphaerae bacterium]|nr:DUF58 domain-containing protein [Phycisphaerae bacterium]MDW8261829.1 DUF58 domain-containing protein [Phycisphaerales bacterium]